MTAPRTAPDRPAVLGEPLTVTVDAHPNAAELVLRAVAEEADRLAGVLGDGASSELTAWRRGDLDEPHSPELNRVLAAAERSWVFTQGGYRPFEGPCEGLPYSAVDGRVRKTGDCSAVSVAELARAYALDCALEAGWRLGLASAVVLETEGVRVARGADGVLVDLRPFLGADAGTLRLCDAALSVARPAGASLRALVVWAEDALSAAVTATVVASGRRGALPGSAWSAVRADGVGEAGPGWPPQPR